MSRQIIFGEIEGIPEGTWFSGRKEMMLSSFHRKWGGGIDGNPKDGVAAIVLSGGYEDDEDNGDEITYTGAGGNEPSTKKQIKDQGWNNTGNGGLLKSMNEGLPVRVIRGFQHKSDYSPSTGYVYSGLYSVVDAYMAIGKSGFQVCKFKLVYSGDNSQRKSIEEVELDYSVKERRTKSSTILRVVRDSKIARSVKELYKHECQVCGIVIESKKGRYAEGAHIKPLGKPHNGEDSVSNLLCLCPNHHVMLDKGVFSISKELNLIGGLNGGLKMNASHKLDPDSLHYHREQLLKL